MPPIWVGFRTKILCTRVTWLELFRVSGLGLGLRVQGFGFKVISFRLVLLFVANAQTIQREVILFYIRNCLSDTQLFNSLIAEKSGNSSRWKI